MNHPIIFKRSLFAVWREMRYVIALAIAYLFLATGLTVVVVVPNWGDLMGTEGNKLPLWLGFGLLYVIAGLWVAVQFYFCWRDMNDERYEITPEGMLVTIYQTWAQFYSPRSIEISRIDSGYFKREGRLQYFLNFGDVVLQGGFAKEPFVLKDVPRPARVLRIILNRASQPSIYSEGAVADWEEAWR